MSKFETYITSDSLIYIHLLPNKSFGFYSYSGQSPISYRYNKNTTKGHIDGPYFTIKEHGSGNYSIDDNMLLLNFIKPFTTIDSVSFKKSKSKNKSDSLNIEILFKSYAFRKEIFGAGIGCKINSEDDSINKELGFNDSISLKVLKNRVPFKLIINENYELKIKKKTNQKIEVFINDFKRGSKEILVDRSYSLDELTKINMD